MHNIKQKYRHKVGKDELETKLMYISGLIERVKVTLSNLGLHFQSPTIITPSVVYSPFFTYTFFIY